MRISAGTIALSLTPESVCPKGVTPGNPPITVRAAYSNPADAPRPNAPLVFSVFDNSIKKSEAAANRVGDAISASFNNITNNTTSDKIYKIFYDDKKNCIASEEAKINPQPTLAVSPIGGRVCAETPFTLQASGKGPVTISSEVPSVSVTPDAPNLSATVTASETGYAVFLATDKDGCKSEYLTVGVSEIPVMEPVTTGNVLTICPGQAQPDIALSSNGVQATKADAYKWQQYGSNAAEVGLADYTDQPPTKSVIGGFTGSNNDTNSPQSREVRVTPYNNASGCYGRPQSFVITVNPKPIVNMTNVKICNDE
ncbi:MAG: hypothetical protein CRN43_20345, partial [Candidatus Nephrothrix sp. EaCA]